jgi:hypothetical protein
MRERVSHERINAALHLAGAVDAWDAAIAGNAADPTGAGTNHAAVVACCNVAKEALKAWRALSAMELSPEAVRCQRCGGNGNEPGSSTGEDGCTPCRGCGGSGGIVHEPERCPECKGGKTVSPHRDDIRGCAHPSYIKGFPVCACDDVPCPKCGIGAP